MPVTPVPTEKRAWYDAVGKLRDKSNEFARVRFDLIENRNMVPRDPRYINEYNDLVHRSKLIEENVRKVMSGVDYVANLFKSTFGEANAHSMGQIGVIPLVPLAIIGGSVALLSKWLTDAYMFVAKMNKVKELEASGMSTQQAIATVKQLSPSPFDGIMGMLPMILLGGAALILLPRILKGK